MTVDLELTVVCRHDGGALASFAVTDDTIFAVGGSRVLASSNGRDFAARASAGGNLHSALAVGDQLWVCGDDGLLAVSRDRAATWRRVDLGTTDCLRGLALGRDGALWIVGDSGFGCRLFGSRAERVDFATRTNFTSVCIVRDDVIVLGGDGQLRRWRDGDLSTIACGTTKPIGGLVVSAKGTWIVVGDGGYIGRSPDGQWFTRVATQLGDRALAGVAQLRGGDLIAVADRGAWARSTDDGRTWTVVVDLPDHQLGGLRALARFGRGALIAARATILRIAPSDDATWHQRINEFAIDDRSIDAVFEAGPEGFIANGLASYLTQLPQSDDDDSLDDEPDDPAPLLLAQCSSVDIERVWGTPLPPEAARFLELVRDRPKWSSFEELRLDRAPAVGDDPTANVFELMVRAAQTDGLRTDLADALAGTVCVGSLSNGDTYHLELATHRIVRFDSEEHGFASVVAQSLDDLVYLAALTRASDREQITRETCEHGLRELQGRVAPSYHFEIERRAAGFAPLATTDCEATVRFARARWLTALLCGDDSRASDLFAADLNPVITSDQLAARFDECERSVPAALYAMWRGYVFDEPELERYLEIGRTHRAQLARDSAALIRELRGGRKDLGKIGNWEDMLDSFRSYDLDPRTTEQRRIAEEARSKVERARRDELEGELAETPIDQWKDLAWRWLGDSLAHRVLIERLVARGDRPRILEQMVALDRISNLDSDEQQLAADQLARQLEPELEAILVGVVARQDYLGDLVERPPIAPRPRPAPSTNNAGDAPGWDAIDRALAALYGDRKPRMFGRSVLHMRAGSGEPLAAIAVFEVNEPRPHWHFITYGFTDLFRDKETPDPAISGFGFELTFRLARGVGEAAPPNWALNFIQNLARYVFSTGNRFGVNHKMGLNGPIALDVDTKITAICFAADPKLTEEIASPHGSAQFVQVVGITDDEYRLIQEWSTPALVEMLQAALPLLVTDLDRRSLLDDPLTAAEVRRRVARDGSAEDMAFAGDLTAATDDGRVRLELGALYAAAIPRAMRGRIAHAREYEMRGNTTVRFEPGERPGYRYDDDTLVLTVPQALARELEAKLAASRVGSYRFDAWPALEIVISPTFIRHQSGEAYEVRGIEDPAQARQMIDEYNARLARPNQDDDEDDDDDDDDDWDDDDSEASDEVPPPDRIRAAVRLNERALRLSPSDDEVQSTHAMLLIDAERAGIECGDLIEWLGRFKPQIQVGATVQLAKHGLALFDRALDMVLGGAPLPGRILGEGGSANLASYGDVSDELYEQLAQAVAKRAPDKMPQLAALLPDKPDLLFSVAYELTKAKQHATALAIYDRILALPIPDEGSARTTYLRTLNNACIQAHAAKQFEAAVRIADRAQPVAHENPYIYHSAACAYAAVGDYQRAFGQVRLAVEHNYDHLDKVEVDSDLGPLLEWPEFRALFRDWRATQEGN